MSSKCPANLINFLFPCRHASGQPKKILETCSGTPMSLLPSCKYFFVWWTTSDNLWHTCRPANFFTGVQQWHTKCTPAVLQISVDMQWYSKCPLMVLLEQGGGVPNVQ